MRTRAICLVGSLAMVSAVLCAHGQEITAEPNSPLELVEPDATSRLDELFATLKSTSDAETAKSTENDIIAIWYDSGSATVDLLMRWTLDAAEEENYPLALDFLDRIVSMRPGFAEAWKQRANIHVLVGDYAKAIADIEQTLALEPRHFAAMSGLGLIMEAIGDRERAMIAYRQALAIDPHLGSVREALEEIEAEDAGRGI
jgi:tetratricopeptide (TPR) repeat protein